MDNCIAALKLLLNRLNVKYTQQFIEDNILSHPEHPSLLCISDTLEKYSIETLPVKVDGEKLKELPLPCIVQLSDSGGMFHLLEHFSDEEAVYLNDKGKTKTVPSTDFLDRWTGICLLVESSETSAEPEIKRKLMEAKGMNFLKWAVAILFSGWILMEMVQSFILGSTPYFLGIIYMVLKLIGLVTGTMLLWYEVDKYNPTLQSFCSGSGGNKINCNAVLESKYAKLFDGQLSLGLLGFSYFFGTLSLLVIARASISSLTLSSYLSLSAVPVIFASIYYQAAIIKQWCRFCIVMQAVLMLEVLVVLIGSFHQGSFQFTDISFFLAMLLLPIFVWKWLKPVLEERKEANLHKRGLKKIKNNPDVLHGLLSKTRKITTSTEGLGITLSSESAKYNVVKVCNPYCGPCANAHPILEELLEKGKINLQILFNASTDKNDRKAKPVGHFLAVDAQGDRKRTQRSLDDWYLTKEKDYETFAKKYPMNGELEQQDTKIKAMRQWCNAEKITHTPTIFINGHELPKEYSVEDLKEVLG
ncbi:vitamin K epoxide reductase family protein [Flagellimonas onchidii]|uniref:vitamin K epoxide reductase family protein n=1 Tax=Flagellimonas onchidii TaxID=2562684 RepID=UPI0010A5D888|nr:vitamin K epoxide reductase family protein [Allomuricauda onchidii]